MNLKDLRIKLMDYGPFNGKYVGTAEFSGEKGTIALNLNPEHIEKIFSVCADGIIDVAQSAARDMTCAVIEHKREIAK